MTTPFRVRHGLIADVSSNTQSAIVASNQVLTGSANTSLVNLATTWNTSGTPTAFRLNVTDTASAAGSLLMDLQVGGAPKLSVSKSGGFKNFLSYTDAANNSFVDFSWISSTFKINVSRAGSTSFPGALEIGRDVNYINFSSAGINFFGGGNNGGSYGGPGGGFTVENRGYYAWSNAINAVSNPDTFLTRRGPANLRLGAADAAGSAISISSIATNQLTLASNHGLTSGAAVQVTFTAGGAVPSGTAVNTTYYARRISDTVIELYTTYQNAVAASGTTGIVSVTTAGTTAFINRAAPFQTLSVQSFTGTDIPGQPFVITGSQGTGTGRGGDIIFQVAPAGTTGTSQNALATALTILGDGRVGIGSTANQVQFGISPSLTLANWLYFPNTGGIVFDVTAQSTVAMRSPLGGTSIVVASENSNAFLCSGDTSWAALGGRVSSGGEFTWSTVTHDALFYAFANSNLVEQRRRNNGQTFRLYGRFTDVTNDFERFFISAPTTSGAAVQLGTQKGATSGSARAIEFQTDSVTRMTIANTGNVGIGITSPTSNLHVIGTANVTSDLSIGGTLTVTGNTTIANLSANGVSAIDAENLVVSGNITAGNLIIQSTLALTTLTVSGNITSTNNITSSNNIVALVDVIATRNTVTGNITANGSLTVTGNVTAQNLTVSGTTSITAEELVIGTVKHNSYSVFANTTSSLEIDSFANTVRSAVYTITANNANQDSYITTLAVTGKGNLLEYGNVSSNGALATFSAAEVSGNVRVNAAATFANTTYYIYRITQGL